MVRRSLEEWKQEEFKPKLKILVKDNFDDLSDLKPQLEGYDAFLCTLGALMKIGEP